MKKMMLTGAMTVIGAGSPIQIIIALLIVLMNMLAVLKIGPFVDEADDWLSFLTSFQMLMTLLGGLILKMQSMAPADSQFDTNAIGTLLIVINCMGFFALGISICALHPKVRKCINKCSEPKADEDKKDTAEESSTKVVPMPPATPPVGAGKSGENAVKFWDSDGAAKAKDKEQKEKAAKAELLEMSKGAAQLVEDGHISEATGNRIAVAHMMCVKGTITLEDLEELLRTWAEKGRITEKELEHLLGVYRSSAII